MATGIIAALGNNATVMFTPNNDAKVKLACSGSATNITVNSVQVFTGNATIANVEFYAAAGVAVTVATGASATCVVSALEA